MIIVLFWTFAIACLAQPLLLVLRVKRRQEWSEQITAAFRASIPALPLAAIFFGFFGAPALRGGMESIASCFICVSGHGEFFFKVLPSGMTSPWCRGELGEYMVTRDFQIAIAFMTIFAVVSIAYVLLAFLAERLAARVLSGSWVRRLASTVAIYAVVLAAVMLYPGVLKPIGIPYNYMTNRVLPGLGEFPFGTRPATRLLSNAFAMNDLALARHYLDNGADVSKIDITNFAAAKDYFDMLRLLVENGANVNAGVGTWRTALSVADLETAEYLLEQGADPDGRDHQGGTELHRAKDHRKAELFLKYGADIEASDDRGRTPLMHAVEDGGVSLVRTLVEHDADTEARDKEGWTALTIACAGAAKADGKSAAAMVRLLIEGGAQVNQTGSLGRTCLWWTSAERSLNELSTFLLEQGADPNLADDSGDRPMDRAAARDNTAGLDLLLQHPRTRKEDAARVTLLKQGITVDIRGVHRAAEEGNLQVVQQLLGAGVDPNADGDCARLLSRLVYKNHFDVMAALLERGGDPNPQVRPNQGRATSPLIVATTRRNAAMVRLLLEHGAEVNYKDEKYERRALHHAAADGLLDIAKILIEHGADLDAVNYQGKTPLDMAIDRGRTQVAELLREAGARK